MIYKDNKYSRISLFAFFFYGINNICLHCLTFFSLLSYHSSLISKD